MMVSGERDGGPVVLATVVCSDNSAIVVHLYTYFIDGISVKVVTSRNDMVHILQ